MSPASEMFLAVVKLCACFAKSAVPNRSPLNPPVAVIMPLTFASPSTVSFDSGVAEPIPTFASDSAVEIPI